MQIDDTRVCAVMECVFTRFGARGHQIAAGRRVLTMSGVRDHFTAHLGEQKEKV